MARPTCQGCLGVFVDGLLVAEATSPTGNVVKARESESYESVCAKFFDGRNLARVLRIGARRGTRGGSASQPHVREARYGLPRRRCLHAAWQRPVSGHACGPRRRLADWYASAIGKRCVEIRRARLHSGGDQLSARAAVALPCTDLRLPGGRALDARARYGFQD